MPQANVCPASPASTPSNGGRLVSTEGRELPLRRADVSASACGGIARVELTQEFANPYAEPLRVTYQTPLPADGAVSGYRFEFGEEIVTGRVEPKAAAREAFEQAIIEGRTAALLEEERSSLFTQEVGNIPAGQSVKIVLTIDQPLTWFREAGRAGWEWRFPTVVGPRFLGEPGRVPDAAKIVTATTADPIDVAVSLSLEIRDADLRGAPASPSHGISSHTTAGTTGVALSDGRAALDRDIVVRWELEQQRAGVRVDLARPPSSHAAAGDAFALLTVTPPTTLRPDAGLARDLIVLLDTSGSMGGEPLDQGRRIVGALIDTLTDRDQLELIEFSTSPRRWKRKPVEATARAKSKAHQWLAGLQARGGTQMKEGVLAALDGLRPEAQRQVVLVSDGYIGFEAEIISTILDRLPAGSRLHTVGVGSAVNRSLTQPSARAGRGLEIVVGLGEDPERAAARLVAATEQPVIVDLQIEGDALIEAAPARALDLYAGAPAKICARVSASGGEVRVRGRTREGTWEQRVRIEATTPMTGSAAVPCLWARERVEDLEMVQAARAGAANHGDVATKVERLGVEFQISTRMTSWVAVSSNVTVDPTDPSRREVMPHVLPHGTSIDGFGLRGSAASSGGPGAPVMQSLMAPPPPMPAAAPAPAAARPPTGLRRRSAPKRREQDLGAPEGFGGRGGGGPQAKGRADKMKKEALPAEAAMLPMDDSDDEAFDGFVQADLGEAIAGEVAGRVLTGRWTQRGTRWVFEASLDEALHWSAPASVWVVLADGTRHSLNIDPAKTTRSGALAAGLTLRLVVERGPSLVGQTPVSVEVDDTLGIFVEQG